MERVYKLRQEAEALLKQAEAIEALAKAENRECTADETAKVSGLIDQADAKLTESKEVELAVKAALKRDAIRAELANTGGRDNPAAPNRRGQILGPEAKRDFSGLGEFLATVAFNPNDQRLHYQEFNAATDQSYGSGTRGGFAVPEQFSGQFLQVSPQAAVFRPRANVIPAGSPPDSAILIPALDQSTTNGIYGGVSVSWIQEGATKPQTDANLKQIRLEPHEIAGHIAVTDTLLRNWAAAEAFLGTQLNGALLAAEDYAFYRGTGIGQPLGILNSAAIKTVSRTTTGHVTYADLAEMYSVMKVGGAPFWLISQSVLPDLLTMEDTEGHLIWQPNAAGGTPGTLLGLPIVITERSPALGTAGDVALIDAKYYLIKDGSGPFVSMGAINDDFTKNKSRIKIFRLVDGKPWVNGLIPLENGGTVSPFVILGDFVSA